jgi:hypothetical protein
MTTEPITEVSPGATPTAPCAACGDPVQIRRPSLSGAHFCSRPGCAKAKHRFYYQRRRDDGARREELARQDAEQERDRHIVALVYALAHAEKVTCADCGRTDALSGYAHLDQQGEGCAGTKVDGVKWPSGLGSELARVIWPPVSFDG